MSLKAELETWSAALKAYEEQDFLKAISLFEKIADTSKILTNIGLIQATIGEHDKAVDSFNAATVKDPHLAIAYFQCGVSNFLLKRYDMAYEDFRVTMVHLRGNSHINYEQIGLDFRLYAAEVLFNKGLCRIYQNKLEEGLEDLKAASEAKETEDQNVIDEAIADLGDGYTVFSIPVGKLYKPSESKVKNAQTKDYLGKAKLVAAADARDAYTTFVGATRLQQGLTPSGAPLNDRSLEQPDVNISGPMDKPVAATTDRSLSRSKTMNTRTERTEKSNAASPTQPIVPGPPGVDRSKDTSSSSSARTRTASESNINPPRSNVPPPNLPTFGMPVRGLSVRRPNATESPAPTPPPKVPGQPERRPTTPQQARRANARKPVRSATIDGSDTSSIRAPPQRPGPQPQRERSRSRGPTTTQFYDDYLDAYGGIDEPLPVDMPMRGLNLSGPGAGGGSVDRVAAWARGTTLGAPPNLPPSRAPSQRLGSAAGSGRNSAVDPDDGYGNQALRRKLSRKPTNGVVGRRSRYDPDDDGGASGDFEDSVYGMVKIRVKLHYADDVRGMALTPDTTFEEFTDKVALKFGKRYGELAMKFTDEDGGIISLRDEMDYELAIETAKAGSKSSTGKLEGRLEVWLTD